ncbi:MAG: hypothetical protein KGJ14_03100, partial [Nitrospirota bacterium]|nr:hypothetical protein [Nitrospirota bacterium]
MDPHAQIGSLHPLEIKVLIALRQHQALQSRPLRQEDIGHAAGLEPSQLSMAVEWLLAKALIRVESEVVTPIASLSKVGERYFEKYAPIERILSVV